MHTMKYALNIQRRDWQLIPDARHVICRPHIPSNPYRIHKIIHRILALDDAEKTELFAQILLGFSDRHRYLKRTFDHHFSLVESYIPSIARLKPDTRLLIGAYFTMEYAVASAALLNPSIVLHPNQSDLPPNSLRFIMSLRAIGEGHISSIAFRTGIIDSQCRVGFDPRKDYNETPVRHLNPSYDKHLFTLKLLEMKACNDIVTQIMSELSAQFSYNQLQHAIGKLYYRPHFTSHALPETIAAINWLANSNYELRFNPLHPINERVIFPTSSCDSGGIDDARFVQFHGDQGDVTYYATYTAYEGSQLLPQLLETKDFVNFDIITLNGHAVQNRTLALFPRKINGKYVMLSCQDNENNHIMFSDHLHFWQNSAVIQQPQHAWEFVQIGNCGSPLETDWGWLVLTKCVGPMREYSIGAILLDRDDPKRVIGSMTQPLMRSHDYGSNGYVPNMVYSCGALIHHNELMIPYAMSDISCGLANISVDEIIANMDFNLNPKLQVKVR